MMMQFIDEKKRQGYRLTDVCGTKLYSYAESFRELARSFDREESIGQTDRRALFEEEKLRENCGVIAGHLREMASIMEQTAGEVSGLESLEERDWRKLSHGLRERGILLEGACLINDEKQIRRLSLTLRTDKAESIPAQRAQEPIRQTLGQSFCLSLTSPERIGRERAGYLFVEQPVYMALTGFARVVKGQEQISGDNYSILQSECTGLTLLLSDGTGSGERACRGSGWVLDLAEKMLETGYSPETALRIVNATAVTKEEEVGHPTLDMCCLDLNRGGCEFLKAGGAVSYRKRGKEVEQIDGGRLPLGIFQDLEPHRQYLRLQEGDCVLLMTDGVLEAFREKGYEEAVRNALAGMEEDNPRILAEKLMQLAIFASEGNVRDDMTILAATLWKNP